MNKTKTYTRKYITSKGIKSYTNVVNYKVKDDIISAEIENQIRTLYVNEYSVSRIASMMNLSRYKVQKIIDAENINIVKYIRAIFYIIRSSDSESSDERIYKFVEDRDI